MQPCLRMESWCFTDFATHGARATPRYAAAAQGIGLSGDRAGLPPLRLITATPDRPRARDVTDAPIAEVRGINVHAAQVVDGRDRRRVERL